MIQAGTKVTCPECGTAIAEIVRQIDSGDRLAFADFRALSAPIVGLLAPTKCHMCDANWFDNGSMKVHTEHGWAC